MRRSGIAQQPLAHCSALRLAVTVLFAGIACVGGLRTKGTFAAQPQQNSGSQQNYGPQRNAAGKQEPDALQVLQSFETVLSETIARCEGSVVAIARVRKEDVAAGVDPTAPDFVPHEYATGAVIDSAGLILTNFHVMREDSDYWVTTSKRAIYKVTDWWGDERLDLAVLRIEADHLPAIEFGDADNLRKGKLVIALGNPYAIARNGQVCASWGIISNLNRKPAAETERKPATDSAQLPGVTGGLTIRSTEQPTIHHYGTLIYTDVRLERGTSGGALVDLNGRMIGLTTSLADHVGYEKSAGYAIALDKQMQAHIDKLKSGEEIELGYLGIHVEDQPELYRAGVPGVLVRSTVFGTSAEQAGLRAGDVVLAVDGEPIFDTDSLFLQFRERSVDDVVTLLVQRGSGHQQLRVALDKVPPTGRQKFIKRPDWRGLRVDHSSVQIRSGFGRTSLAGQGVAVTEVARESAAWQAGLRTGMIITAVNGTPVTHPQACRQILATTAGPVTLTVDASANDAKGRIVVGE